MEQMVMTEPARHIGIVGTFDVQNYGDLLFPLIAEAELRRRLGPLTLHRFSYQEKTVANWSYAVTPLHELPNVIGGLDGLIVGGGDIIRFDQDVAPGYGSEHPLVHHPTGYWLMPMLLAFEHDLPVVWNAPGVYRGIPRQANALMKLAIEGSNYVSVRDEASRRVLMRYSSDAEIIRVPDTAFGLAQLIDPQVPSSEFKDVCQARGINQPYIVLQAADHLRDFLVFVRERPHLFGEYQIVVLPIGSIFGEDSAKFAAHAPEVVQMPSTLPPWLVAEVISHASAVVGVSLHFSVSALVFGVPVFRPAFAFNDKYASLSHFKRVIPFESFEDIAPHLFKREHQKIEPDNDLRQVNLQLGKHWDKMAQALLTSDTSFRTGVLKQFSQSMPGFLKGEWPLRYAMEMEKMKLPREAEERFPLLRKIRGKAQKTLRAMKR